MKHLLLAACLFLTVVAAGEEKPAPVVQNEKHNELILALIKDFEAIRLGMTRAEVDRKFNQDGGISTPVQSTYIHPESRHVKIQVTYENTRHDPEGRPIELPGDKVVKISLPFLQCFTSD